MLKKLKMFRHIILLMMLCWISVLSGCAEITKGHQYFIDDGQYNAGEGYKGNGFRCGFSCSTPDKAQVTEACWVEATNRVGQDFMADDRARRIYFNQCYLRNGYDTDGKYIGIPPE
jgi:hypothetical protein